MNTELCTELNRETLIGVRERDVAEALFFSEILYYDSLSLLDTGDNLEAEKEIILLDVDI